MLRPLTSILRSKLSCLLVLLFLAAVSLIVSQKTSQLNQHVSTGNSFLSFPSQGSFRDLFFLPLLGFDNTPADGRLSFTVFSDLTAPKLGVASNIYVVSLAKRHDRRAKMDEIKLFLDLDWEYVDALDKSDRRVGWILQHVKAQRTLTNGSFDWPEYLLDSSYSYLTHEVDLWTLSDDPRPGQSYEIPDSATEVLLCADGDSTLPTDRLNQTSIPYHLILSRGMIACWFSHMSVIRRVAEQAQNIDLKHWDGKEGVVIIFEDDIDVEVNLHDQLVDMWRDLPKDWDIVMLGHCWSNESAFAPLNEASPLHPSYAPKCTHGYALSPGGALRLLAHLSYPLFAYSRALDQAIAHLIYSGRLKSFSVVPSVVVQQKSERFGDVSEVDEGSEAAGDSDIWETGARGSRWRETLRNSTLQEINQFKARNPRLP